MVVGIAVLTNNLYTQETKARAFSKGDYKEAWIEFSDKEVAKRVVLSYNNQPVGVYANSLQLALTTY